EFVMRGVNMAYTWYKSSAYDQLKAIHNSGANAVRIVLTNGKAYGSPADEASAVKKLIDACKEYGMLAIIEVHDVTGSDKISDLESAAQYFVDIASVLKGTEPYVMINIANEWHNSSAPTNWRDGYKSAIPMIRKAGLRHCIMVDAGGYGQSAATIHTYGKEVLAADEENNVLFSIHMYGTAGNSSKVKSNIDGVINQDLALCIGEFGWYHSDGDVDEDLILSYCQEKKVGWLAWSWYGNGSPVQYLDLVKDASASPVLAEQSAEGQSCEWGKKIVDAWKAEAKMPQLDECSSVQANENVSYDKKDMVYYASSEESLYVSSQNGGKLQVVNLGGVPFSTVEVENNTVVDLSALPSGAYIVVLNDVKLKIAK
ncbi:MAG: cellulase family glycosylhydrolase, partial [Paludibacteraceae bacterium]|nr:cellulase family glycosylhydrolase [Paludibacteraceae bacterium]